ncbi:phage integrase SAM-like domain-containing protein [Klebsiella aerogenes]
MTAKIEHTSYTAKNGYTWRKRYVGSTMSIALLTKDHNTAVRRSTLLTMKFIEYAAHEWGFAAMAETLKKYRDTMTTADKMNQLRATLAATGYDLNNPAMPIPAVAQVSAVALHVAEQAQAANTKHGFEEAKQAWIDANLSDWRPKTLNGFKNSSNKLMAYLATNGVMYVEDVTKDHVRGFKQYLDDSDFAPGSKKSYYNKNQQWFNYMVNDKEWIEKNPFNGLAFKSAEVINIKTPMNHNDFEHVFNLLQHDAEKPIKWMMAVMHHESPRV